MEPSVQRIAVGVASYRRPERVLQPAMELAKRAGAWLHVVHAYSRAAPIEDQYEILGYQRSDALDRFRDFVRAQLGAAVASAGSAERVVCHVEEGSAEWLLNDVANRIDADLVVVGATRRGRLGQQLLGTTAEQTIRNASAPVLLLRGPLSPAPIRLLFAVDLSELGAHVYAQGAGLARALLGAERLETRAVLVVPYLQVLLSLLDQGEVEALARHELRLLLQRQELGDESAEVQVRTGVPAQEILREAQDWKPDLLVVGTHGRRGLERVALGSVAARVARDAAASVLVIPPHWEFAGRERGGVREFQLRLHLAEVPDTLKVEAGAGGAARAPAIAAASSAGR